MIVSISCEVFWELNKWLHVRCLEFYWVFGKCLISISNCEGWLACSKSSPWDLVHCHRLHRWSEENTGPTGNMKIGNQQNSIDDRLTFIPLFNFWFNQSPISYTFNFCMKVEVHFTIKYLNLTSCFHSSFFQSCFFVKGEK